MRNHSATPYIRLDTSRCKACWKCVEVCPQHVLGKVSVFRHKHAHVDHADACKGCRRCVRVCPEQAIIDLRLVTPHVATPTGESGEKTA